MKILAFADTHDDTEVLAKLREKAKGVDLMLCAGDISEFGKDLKEHITSMDIGLPMIIIHGNHEDLEDIDSALKGLSWATNLHKKSICMDGILFMGCGGGGLSAFHTPFERASKLFKEELASHKGKSVVITHAPPYGTKTDTMGMMRCGVKSMREFIETAQPDYWICGHLHELASKQDKVGKTIVINPGKEGIVLDL